jgi:hypothetical protein
VTDAMSEPAKPPRKPWRLWILQAIATVQVLFAAVRGIPLVKDAGRHLLELAGLWWLLQMLFPIALAAMLVLAIERAFRRSDVVAQVAGALWWTYGLYGQIRALLEPTPPHLKGLIAEDVPLDSQIAALVILQGLLLWFVASLRWHRASRAYLAGTTPIDGVPTAS